MNKTFRQVLGLAAVIGATLALCSGCSGGGDTAPTTAPTEAPTTVITTTTHPGMMNGEVNVREGPGFGYASLGGIRAGSDIVIVGREGDWYKIEFGDGYGYVSAHYVDVSGASNASQMIASRAPATTVTTMATTKPSQATKPGQTTTTVSGATATATNADGTVPTVANGIPDTQANDQFQ